MEDDQVRLDARILFAPDRPRLAGWRESMARRLAPWLFVSQGHTLTFVPRRPATVEFVTSEGDPTLDRPVYLLVGDSCLVDGDGVTRLVVYAEGDER